MEFPKKNKSPHAPERKTESWAEVPCEELLCEFVNILTSHCWHVQLMCVCVLRSVVAVIGAFCFRHTRSENWRGSSSLSAARSSSSVLQCRRNERSPSLEEQSTKRAQRCALGMRCEPKWPGERILSAFWSVKLPPDLRADTLGHRRGIFLWNEDVIHSL